MPLTPTRNPWAIQKTIEFLPDKPKAEGRHMGEFSAHT